MSKPKKNNRRTNEDISNDISEGMPVTPGEVLRVLKWERSRTLRLQKTIDRLREAMSQALRGKP